MRHTEFFADRPVKPKYRPVIEDPTTVGIPSDAPRVMVEVLSFLISELDDGYRCAPPKTAIASYFQRSPKAIRRAFAFLEARELIRKTGRKRGAGRLEYEVRPEWLEPAAADTSSPPEEGTSSPPAPGTSCPPKTPRPESKNPRNPRHGGVWPRPAAGTSTPPPVGTMCPPEDDTSSPSGTAETPGGHDVPTRWAQCADPGRHNVPGFPYRGDEESSQGPAAAARERTPTREPADRPEVHHPPPPPLPEDPPRRTDGAAMPRAIRRELGRGAFDEVLEQLFETHRKALFADGKASAVTLPTQAGQLELFCSIAAAMKAELRDDDRDDVQNIRGLTEAIYRSMVEEPGEALDAVRSWMTRRLRAVTRARQERAVTNRQAAAAARPRLPDFRDSERDGPEAGLMAWIERHAPAVRDWLVEVARDEEAAEWLERLRVRFEREVRDAGLARRAHHQRQRFVAEVGRLVEEVVEPGKRPARTVAPTPVTAEEHRRAHELKVDRRRAEVSAALGKVVA